MKKILYLITILTNCLFAFSQSPYKFSIQPAIEVDANFYKITLELKEGKDDDYKQKDKVDLPVTFLFNNKFVTGKYTGPCIKIKVLYTDSKKEQSDKLYLPSGKGKFTSALFSYDGDWQFGSFNGKGKIQWIDYEYEGDFVKGQFIGIGKMVYANGNIYEGNWLNNDRTSGYGKMIYKDGTIKDGLKGNHVHTYPFYEGNWVFEIFNGKGKMTYTNGDTLNGIWNGLKFNGYGKLTLTTGEIYEGNWKDGEKNGKGKLTKVNGEVLDGLFNMGLFTGKAKIRYENGNTYDGDYVDNKFQGNGTYTFKTGGSYIGQWADNKYNGKGKLTNTYGDVYEGDFVNSKKQGNGKMTQGDVIIYNGQWANDLYNGHGELIMPTQTGDNPYIGDFVDGKKQGNGTQKYNHELGGVVTYTGQWANDEYNGQGKLKLRDNKIQEGLFVNGIYQPIAKKTATTVKTAFKEVTIGTQVWMAENVTVAKFRNGDIIPQVKTIDEFKKVSGPAWCYYEFSESNGLKYGKLYNWYAVNDPRGLAPIGWRIPKTDDFWLLLEFSPLNKSNLEKFGYKYSPISSDFRSKVGWGNIGTNTSGFNALPAGYKGYTAVREAAEVYIATSSFKEKGKSTYFWTSQAENNEEAYTFYVDESTAHPENLTYKYLFYSVRCLKE